MEREKKRQELSKFSEISSNSFLPSRDFKPMISDRGSLRYNDDFGIK